MNKELRGRALWLLCVLAIMILPGCHFKVSVGTDEYLTGEDYPDAEKYTTGALTYHASAIKRAEIYWRLGEVEMIESDKAELSVWESGSKLSEKDAMHYFLDQGVLRVRFCESGAKIHVNEDDKHLHLEVPKGIDISVHTTSAVVKADALEQKSILIAALSGNMQLKAVTAENMDLSNGSGSVEADGLLAKTLKCSTATGSVRLNGVSSGTTEIETNDGNMELAFDKAPAVSIRTAGGKVDLTLPPDGAAVSYISNSGKLLTDRTYERKGDLYVFGDGKSKLTIETANGNLIIQ